MFTISEDTITIFSIYNIHSEITEWLEDLLEEGVDPTEEAADEVMSSPGEEVKSAELNLEMVQEIDATGVQLLMALANKLRVYNFQMKLKHVQPEVAKLLNLSGVQQFADFEAEGGEPINE